MRKCPQCGFEGTLSNRRILALFAKHFPGLPVGEMIARGWIQARVFSNWQHRDEWCTDEIPEMLAEILGELQRFFECPTVEELKAMLHWEGELMDADDGSIPNLPLFSLDAKAETT